MSWIRLDTMITSKQILSTSTKDGKNLSKGENRKQYEFRVFSERFGSVYKTEQWNIVSKWWLLFDL